MFGFCGERGIRTPGTLLHNGFQDHRIRPLCQLSNSAQKYKIFLMEIIFNEICNYYFSICHGKQQLAAIKITYF